MNIEVQGEVEGSRKLPLVKLIGDEARVKKVHQHGLTTFIDVPVNTVVDVCPQLPNLASTYQKLPEEFREGRLTNAHFLGERDCRHSKYELIDWEAKVIVL